MFRICDTSDHYGRKLQEMNTQEQKKREFKVLIAGLIDISYDSWL